MESKSKKKVKSSAFEKFFIDQLKDIYWAEKHLHQSLKKLRKAATSEALAAAFEQHVLDTEWQIESVENIFKLMGKTPQAKKCDAMEGLIQEAVSVIEDTENDSYTRDAGLILAAQKVEHYEIATYGTLRIFAGHLGEEKVEKELEKILENEKQTDVILTKLAEDHINEQAAEE